MTKKMERAKRKSHKAIRNIVRSSAELTAARKILVDGGYYPEPTHDETVLKKVFSHFVHFPETPMPLMTEELLREIEDVVA